MMGSKFCCLGREADAKEIHGYAWRQRRKIRIAPNTAQNSLNRIEVQRLTPQKRVPNDRESCIGLVGD